MPSDTPPLRPKKPWGMPLSDLAVMVSIVIFSPSSLHCKLASAMPVKTGFWCKSKWNRNSQYLVTTFRHPREGGGPTPAVQIYTVGDGFPPSRE
jgi:hypothetical protein